MQIITITTSTKIKRPSRFTPLNQKFNCIIYYYYYWLKYRKHQLVKHKFHFIYVQIFLIYHWNLNVSIVVNRHWAASVGVWKSMMKQFTHSSLTDRDLWILLNESRRSLVGSRYIMQNDSAYAIDTFLTSTGWLRINVNTLYQIWYENKWQWLTLTGLSVFSKCICFFVPH